MTQQTTHARSIPATLALEPVDEWSFRTLNHHLSPSPRLFGGQVAGQAVMAAGRTVPVDRPIHVAQMCFLLRGDATLPIDYEVEQVRDGGSFSTRQVVAWQQGRRLFTMLASFHQVEPGFEHQLVELRSSPDATPEPAVTFADRPEELAWVERMAGPTGIELRFPVLPARSLAGTGSAGEPHQSAWLRAVQPVADADPLEQAACLAYLSDLMLLSTALAPHGRTLQDHDLQFATVNHTIWFHAPLRVDEWFLYDQHSRWAGGARALCHGEIIDRTGRLCATTMQEGLLRVR